LADRPSALENKDLRLQIAVQRSSVNHVDLDQLLKVTAPIKLGSVLLPENPGPNLSPHPPNPRGWGHYYPDQNCGRDQRKDHCPGRSFAQSVNLLRCKSLIVPETRPATLAQRMATSKSPIASFRRPRQRTTPESNGKPRCTRQRNERSLKGGLS
jgi:hypothetical protein